MKTQYRGFFITRSGTDYNIDGLKNVNFKSLQGAKDHIDTTQDSLNRGAKERMVPTAGCLQVDVKGETNNKFT